MVSSGNASGKRRQRQLVNRLRALTTPPDAGFDRLVELAAAIAGTPYAGLGLIDDDSIWFISQVGFDLELVPVGFGLETTVIVQEALVTLEDAALDPASANHPMVVGEPGVRFYAGVPVILSSGATAGVLCVFDTVPREPSPDLGWQLKTLAASVVDLLEARTTGNAVAADVRLALNAALERESILTTIVENLPEAIFTTTIDGIITSWNPGAEQLYGYTFEDIEGLHVSVLGPNGSGVTFKNLLARVAARERIAPFDTLRMDHTNYVFEAIDSVAPIFDPAGNVVGAAWSSRDAREIRRLESIVWEEKERSESAFALVADAIVMADVEGRVTYLNPAAEQLTGWTTVTAHGKPAREIVELIHEESRQPVESPVDVALRESRPVERGFHNVLVSREGVSVPVEDAATPIRDREGVVAGAVMVLRPVGRKQTGRQHAHYLSEGDQLTGALSRREFEHRLEQALVSAARENASHALLYVTINEFQEFVEGCGRVAANELLRQVAVMLRTQVRDLDFVARMYDDEFAILLPHCPLHQARRIAGQTSRTLRNFPFLWEQRTHMLSVRVGVVPVTADSGSTAKVLQVAEVVCRSASVDGPGSVHVLEVGDINRAIVSKRLDPARMIGSALDEDRFRLYGQRIVPAGGGEGDVHCEMLLHMLDENGDVYGPSTFLPAARRNDLLVDLDRWVVRSVLRMLHEARRTDALGALRDDVSRWAINLSAEALADPVFPNYIKAQFGEFDVPPDWVCFEIDEADAVEHLGDVQRLMSAVRPMGVAFCLSHFGPSLNAFAYLRNLHVDYIKIDGSIVRGVVHDAVDRELVHAITQVAHVMGVKTIAERVEDPDALSILEAIGVDYVQGFAIGEPLPLPLLS